MHAATPLALLLQLPLRLLLLQLLLHLPVRKKPSLLAYLQSLCR